MSPAEKKKLNEALATLDRNERMKLMKRASQLRKLATLKSKPILKPRFDEEMFADQGLGEDHDDPIPMKRQKSLDDYLWQIIQADAAVASAASDASVTVPVGSNEKVEVVGVVKNGFEVLRSSERVICRASSFLTEPVAVGDQVFVEDVDGELFVVAIAPRRTVLSRPDVGNANKQRVIAANLDAVVVVVSIVSPPLHPRLIDRYLLAIQHGGALPMLVVNKLDLADEVMRREELAKLNPYRDLGIPIFECVAQTGLGVSQLRVALAGKLAAFVGHSGVGKSSLINAFDARLDQSVGAVSEGYGRGTHTTTRSSLIDLGDLRVIDTPGIRSFGLWDIQAEDLKGYFPEFEGVGRCRFNDCTHVHEPECAVKREVGGAISGARYETYLRILSSFEAPG